jgi:hypothetical protein
MKNRLLNKPLGVVILVAAVSLVFSPTFANAEIKVTPPSNWQANPDGVKKAPDSSAFHYSLQAHLRHNFLRTRAH